MSDTISRGPPEPAAKRPHSQYNTPLSQSPSSDYHPDVTDSDMSPPPGDVPTTVFRNPMERNDPCDGRPPLSPAIPTTTSSSLKVATPIAIRPQSEITTAEDSSPHLSV